MAKQPSHPAPRDPVSSAQALEPLRLQAYYDGELPEDEAHELAAHLVHGTDDQARLAALQEMGDLVRFDNEQALELLDSSAFTARIIAATAALPSHPAKAATATPNDPGTWLDRVMQSLGAYFAAHRKIFIPATVLLAMAALVMLPMLLSPQAPTTLVEKERTIVIVEPLHLEGGASGSVSYTPHSNTPVIWYLGSQSPETSSPTLDAAPLRIAIHNILQRLEKLEKNNGSLLNDWETPTDSQRRYNIDIIKEAEWFQRHRSQGPI